MLALKNLKSISLMRAAMVKRGVDANNSLRLNGIMEKNARPCFAASFNKERYSETSHLIPSLIGTIKPMRFYCLEPSVPSPSKSKVMIYWQHFLDKKEKFEHDVDHYLARWPTIRIFRRQLIANMQKSRAYIFDRLVETYYILLDKKLWEKYFYRFVAIIWDIIGGILNLIRNTINEHILQTPKMQQMQTNFFEKMERAKEVVPFPPNKQEIENFAYRLVALLWDVTNWFINSTKINFEQHVVKHPKVQQSWTQFKEKMEKARNNDDTTTSSRVI